MIQLEKAMNEKNYVAILIWSKLWCIINDCYWEAYTKWITGAECTLHIIRVNHSSSCMSKEELNTDNTVNIVREMWISVETIKSVVRSVNLCA